MAGESVSPATSVQGTPSVQTSAAQTPSQFAYAGVGSRLLASLLDGLIVGIPVGILNFAIGFIGMALVGPENYSSSPGIILLLSAINWIIQMVIVFGYNIYFIGSCGQTLGKKALKIKVIKLDSGQAPGYGGAALREIIGKLVSSFVFGLGYLWAIWDSRKQTWHDKIAGTVVVKI